MPDRAAPDADDPVRRLYEQPPDGFVAARSAAVTAARKAGDQDAAKRYAALRKPTVAAWLVNLLALRRPELLDELVELAAALRTAQRGLHGEQLRELSTQRRRVVSALVAEARTLAAEADPGLGAGKLPLAEVEATLTAALAETAVAEQVRSGRLVRAVTYAGFGEVPRPRLRLVTADDEVDPADADDDVGAATTDGPAGGDAAGGSGGVPPGDAGSGGGQRRDAWTSTAATPAAAQAAARRRLVERRRELERELSSARAAETRARKQVERADAAERDAGHVLAEIEAALAELERRRSLAQGDVSHRKLALRAAEREASTARRRVGDVQAALEGLEQELSD